MADTKRRDVEQRTGDTAEYSATRAPETKAEAEEPEAFSDERLRPGGPHGSPAQVGAESMDRDATRPGGQDPAQTDYSKTRRSKP
jgi:hypothetical protein